MSFVLMVVGLLATAIGAILIGFGIPINEFSLGNTLILAGTVTVVGGLIIFALSRAVSQLSRIADTLASRPMPAMSHMPESYDPHPDVGRHAPARGPAAPRPRADTPPAPRAPEPRLQAEEFELPQEVEPVRPPPPVRAPQPEIGEDDMVPSPRGPARAAPDAAPKAGWRPPRPAPAAPEPRTSKPTADARRQTPPSDNPFDAAWEDRKAPSAGTSPRQPSTSAPEAGRQEPVSVLKSGIVDGMAYTLYTDGSIEAELAHGVVRFGSIEELRNHLEKSA